MKSNFSAINTSKANFDDIYTMDDPRAYFSTLGALDYMIPDVAEPAIRQILMAKTRMDSAVPCVVDVGCSYGINAAVHRYPLNFDTLRRRYARRELMSLAADELAALDRNFFSGWPETGLARFIGLDASAPAIRYAKTVGHIDDGIVADLENEDLSPENAQILRRASLVLSTGCVGYVTEKTYSKILASMERPTWIVSFVLRIFPYDAIAEALAGYGLITEKLAGATFVQRRFRDAGEFEQSLTILEKRGIETLGLEAEGLFHAELYLSRPEIDVRALPLEEMVTVTTGRHRPVGPRYVHIQTDTGRHVAVEP